VFAPLIADGVARYGAVIRATGIEPEQQVWLLPDG
jgi:hypothetical protein